MESAGTIWPDLEDGYADEFGAIDHDLYQCASALWPWAASFARHKLGDEATGQRLLCKAAALVTHYHRTHSDPIRNPQAYLARAFKREVLNELERQHGHRQRAEQQALTHLPLDSAAALERKILIQQIVGLMDEWTREVFDLHALNYTFEEIAAHFGMQANVVRSRYSKQLQKIKARLQARPSSDR